MSNLLPQWINVIPYINLTKGCSLTLTPDRSDVIVNNQFIKVRNKIEDKIIEFTNKYLTKIRTEKTDYEYLNYFNDLLEQNVIQGRAHIGFNISKSGIDCILNNMPLLSLNEKGDEHVIFGESIKGAKIILVISENSMVCIKDRKEFRKKINECLGSEAVVIINQELGDYSRSNLIKYIYGSFNREFISEIEGVTCSLIDSREKDINKVHIDGKMHFTDRYNL